MPVKKSGLGKGLDSLIPNKNVKSAKPSVKADEKKAAPKEEILEAGPIMVKINKVEPNREQPRKDFDEDALMELADSIKQFGVLQPILVQKKKDYYEIIAGERRWRAAKLAGLKEVPIIVKEFTEQEIVEISLIENIQRENLNPIEEAQGLRRLMQEFKLTQEQTAEKVGRSRSAVTNILRLLNLPEQVQKQIINGVLTMGQAKQLLGLPKPEQMCEVAEAIIANGWSSRMTEEVVRKLKEGKKLKIVRELIEEEAKNKDNKEKKPKREPTENDIFCHDFEQRLVEFLGTKVKVVPKLDEQGRQGGTIHIEYYSAEDLERIYEVLQQGRHEEKPLNGEPKRLNV